MRTPVVSQVSTVSHRVHMPVPKGTKINRPVKLSPELVSWERDVYEQDPTGGAASRW